jgi:hypothetical protein
MKNYFITDSKQQTYQVQANTFGGALFKVKKLNGRAGYPFRKIDQQDNLQVFMTHCDGYSLTIAEFEKN